METTEKRVHWELSEHAGREESGHRGVHPCRFPRVIWRKIFLLVQRLSYGPGLGIYIQGHRPMRFF